jgi:hypothetical protein
MQCRGINCNPTFARPSPGAPWSAWAGSTRHVVVCFERPREPPGPRWLERRCKYGHWSAFAITNARTVSTRSRPSSLRGLRKFYARSRTNVMIQHPIRAASRISASAIARPAVLTRVAGRKRRRALRLDVAARGAAAAGCRPGPREIPVDARRSESGPPARRINHPVTKP